MVLMLAIPLAALVSAFCAVLQSIHSLKPMAGGLFAGLIVKCCINYPLTRKWGIDGAAWGTVLSLLVTMIIVWQALPQLLRRYRHGGRFVGKLLTITAFMTVLAGGSASLMKCYFGGGRLQAALVLLVAITIGAASAGWLVIRWHLLDDEELIALPGGKRLVTMMTKDNKENDSNETR